MIEIFWLNLQRTKIINIQNLKRLTNPRHMKKSIGIPTDTTTVHQCPIILERIFNKKLQLQSNKCHKIQVWNNFKCRMWHCRAEYHDSLQLIFFFTSAVLFGICKTLTIPSSWEFGVNCRFNCSICKMWMWPHLSTSLKLLELRYIANICLPAKFLNVVL